MARVFRDQWEGFKSDLLEDAALARQIVFKPHQPTPSNEERTLAYKERLRLYLHERGVDADQIIGTAREVNPVPEEIECQTNRKILKLRK